MDSWFSRGHPVDSHEWTECDRMTMLTCGGARLMTAIDYAALAQDALEMIEEFGGTVTFIVDPSDVNGKAVQDENDAEVLSAMGLVARSVVTLLVAAAGLSITPAPGMLFDWAGKRWAIPPDAKAVDTLAPNGTDVVLYTIIGVGGG